MNLLLRISLIRNSIPISVHIFENSQENNYSAFRTQNIDSLVAISRTVLTDFRQKYYMDQIVVRAATLKIENLIN